MLTSSSFWLIDVACAATLVDGCTVVDRRDRPDGPGTWMSSSSEGGTRSSFVTCGCAPIRGDAGAGGAGCTTVFECCIPGGLDVEMFSTGTEEARLSVSAYGSSPIRKDTGVAEVPVLAWLEWGEPPWGEYGSMSTWLSASHSCNKVGDSCSAKSGWTGAGQRSFPWTFCSYPCF